MQPKARLTLSDGTRREGQFGWEDVQGLPDGAVVQQWVQDDTLPRQPRGRLPHCLGVFRGPGRGADERQQRPPRITHAVLIPGVLHSMSHNMLLGSWRARVINMLEQYENVVKGEDHGNTDHYYSCQL